MDQLSPPPNERKQEQGGLLRYLGKKVFSDETVEAFSVMAELLDSMEAEFRAPVPAMPEGKTRTSTDAEETHSRTGHSLLDFTTGLLFVQQFHYEQIFPSGAYLTDPVRMNHYYHYWRHSCAVFGWMLLNKWVFQHYNNTPDFEGSLTDSEAANIEALLDHVNLERSDLICFQFQSALYDPGHFVALDHAEESIVVSIRGSFSVRDCLTDFVANAVPFQGGFAHQGILRSAQTKMLQLEPVIRELQVKHPTYKIVTVGHSLGGACAALLAFMLRESFAPSQTSTEPDTRSPPQTTELSEDEASSSSSSDNEDTQPGLDQVTSTPPQRPATDQNGSPTDPPPAAKSVVRIMCRAYGCPPCVSLELATAASRSVDGVEEPLVTSFAYGEDIIPRLSYFSVKGLGVITKLYTSMSTSNSHSKRLFQMFANSNVLRATLTNKLSTYVDTDRMPSLHEVDDALKYHRSEFKKDRLYIPGRVIYMRSSAQDQRQQAKQQQEVPSHGMQPADNKQMGLKVRMEESNCTFFHEISLAPTFFRDHIPSSYEAAFLRAKNDAVFHSLDGVKLTCPGGNSGVSLQIKLIDHFIPIWKGSSSSTGNKVAFWRPRLTVEEIKAGWVLIGDVLTLDAASQKKKHPRGDTFGLAVCCSNTTMENQPTAVSPITRASAFRLLWHNGRPSWLSFSAPTVFIWMPIPRKDYVALGVVVTTTPYPPTETEFRCVHRAWLGGMTPTARQNSAKQCAWRDIGFNPKPHSGLERLHCPPISLWRPYMNLPTAYKKLQEHKASKAQATIDRETVQQQAEASNLLWESVFAGHTFVVSTSLTEPPPMVFTLKR
jgi:hypothetical protein